MSIKADDITNVIVPLTTATGEYVDENLYKSSKRASSLKEDLINALLEENVSPALSATSSTTNVSNKKRNSTGSNLGNDEHIDSLLYKQQLSDVSYAYSQVKIENENLRDELESLKREMEELQDQFRLDDADEFRQLQAELEIATKNCRILQFKLRKLEKRNDSLETDRLLLQDKFEELSHEIEKVRNLEEELLIAKEVSIRLHSELEQAEEWRRRTDKLNEELKSKLDEIKEQIDLEIKNQSIAEDNHAFILVNKLYESLHKEYVLQEQISSELPTQQESHNDKKQLREITELLNSYQQKFATFTDEINILKQELIFKDRKLEQYKIQLKNLKRSRSLEPSSEQQRVDRSNMTNNKLQPSDGKADESNNNNKTTTSSTTTTRQRSSSADPSEALNRQVDIAYDEIRLLKNKICRLEDDLLFVTQERDCLAAQLDKIEEKAMKSFSTSIEHDVDEIDLDSIVAKQMIELKTKFEKLNKDTKDHEQKNEESKTLKTIKQQQSKQDIDSGNKKDEKDKVISELKNELRKINNDLESYKNLTDNDKLIREEYKNLKNKLDNKTNELEQINELLIQHENTEMQLHAILTEKENFISELNMNNFHINEKLNEHEGCIKNLKQEIEIFKLNEIKLVEKHDKINESFLNCQKQLNEKICDIEFLNRENNLLQERISLDEKRIKNSADEIQIYKSKIDELNQHIDEKCKDMSHFENIIKNKDNEMNELMTKLHLKEIELKEKLHDCEKYQTDFFKIEEKYTNLSKDLDSKVNELIKEIDRLKTDKEKLNFDLQELRLRQINNSKNTAFDIANLHTQNDTNVNVESTNEWSNIQSVALKTKYEAKCQYFELEIGNLKAKMGKLLKEKKIQEQVLKEAQQLAKEISQKYTMDSESWNRQRQQFNEKEKMYEESIEVRKELRGAADKLRQKLQSLEEQINEKQIKHTIEKNNWETQRLQLVSTINRLEEQLSKYKIPKKTKKDLEFGWDKERKELHHQIQTMQIFMKDLQSQLTQKQLSSSYQNDSSNNDSVQSLYGENEFLKNRIKELEIMLDEMEQVKRFLLDIKEAHESEKAKWLIAKDDFHQQIEIRDKIWNECNSKINHILAEIDILNNNASMNKEHSNLEKLHLNIDNKEAHKNKTELNTLCGAASNLFNSNGDHTSCTSSSLNTPTSMNSTNMHSNDQQNSDVKYYEKSSHLSDEDQNAKRLFGNEFNQVCKKLERVKENFNTHKKFMDIVKLKSSKVLHRKPSVTSLDVNEMYQIKKPELRGSVPPDNRVSSMIIPKRAKSVSKEPLENSSLNNLKSSIQSSFTTSRFFSLSRRFPKLRFNSSNQAINTDSLQSPKTPTQAEILKTSKTLKKNQKVVVEKPEKAPTRERALSPSSLFRNLRSRSPFAKSRVVVPKSTTTETTSIKPTTTTTTSTSTSTNKTFPYNVNTNPQMTMSCYSNVDTNTNKGSEKVSESNSSDKLRSVSCEFIDNPALNLNSKMSNQFDETKDNSINVLPLANKTITSQRMKKMNLVGFNTLNTIKNDTIIETVNETGTQQDVVKSVKFKEPPEIKLNTDVSHNVASKTEVQLIDALNAAMSTSTQSNGSGTTTSSSQDEDKKLPHENLKTGSVDHLPPKPPCTPTANTTRVKFASVKSRTIDFPDLLQGTLESNNNSNQMTSTSNTAVNITTPSGNIKPIQSILRRSETPPSAKSAQRQASIESNESNRDRESSIEKRLKITSSTSRPLMFNN